MAGTEPHAWGTDLMDDIIFVGRPTSQTHAPLQLDTCRRVVVAVELKVVVNLVVGGEETLRLAG